MTFDFYAFRFEFTALDAIHFPPGIPANILRGALGSVFRKIACVPDCPGFHGADASQCEFHRTCPYALIFEPHSAGVGPSGLANSPRPFVFRASHLDGATVRPGERFWFGLNLFAKLDPAREYFLLVFERLAREGLGPSRGRAQLLPSSEPEPLLSLALDEGPSEAQWMRVEFVTPTELKHDGRLVSRPDFGVLFARARDRVSSLSALYGAGPLEIDFREMGERAAGIEMTRCDLRHVDTERRSSRTGQIHHIGGFTGVAEYQGPLGEFVPFLQAARWTGVGRQCVWGKGELKIEWGV